jgi:hypothetical protein
VRATCAPARLPAYQSTIPTKPIANDPIAIVSSS